MRNQFLAFFGTAAVAAAVKDVVSFGSKISDLSRKTFLSKSALQEFDYVAQQTGTTLDDFVKAEERLARSQQDAIEGNEELTNIFLRFGLRIQDLKRLNPHQLFTLIADAIHNTELSGRQVDEVLTLMGRSAGNILPAMKEGIDAMIDSANRLGFVLSDEVIDKLDGAADRMTDLKLRSRPIAATLAEAGVDALEWWMMAGKAGIAGAKGLGTATLAGKPNLWAGMKAANESWVGSSHEIANQVGARSLIVEFEKQRRLLENIARSTEKTANAEGGIPNVL